MPKLSLWMNGSDTILQLEDKRIETFLKGICLKLNMMAQLEFKHAYFEKAVQHVSHYAMEHPLPRFFIL